MQPELFIGTRFGVGVRDREWLEHRLALFSAVTAPSMLAQSDQGFQWAIFVDPELPADIRDALQSVLAPFSGRAFLQSTPHSDIPSVVSLMRSRAMESDGYLLTGAIDDDDAWHVSTVGAVRSRVDAWRRENPAVPGLGLTYENGLEWIMYDMLDVEQFQKRGQRTIKRAGAHPYSLRFHSMSVFILAHITHDITAFSMGHSQSNGELARMNFAIDAVSTESPMWLYCRHKQTDSETGTHYDPDVPEVAVTLADLANDFGIDEIRARQYIVDAAHYGYCIHKVNTHLQILLLRELEAVQRKAREMDAGDPGLDEIRQEEERLTSELSGKLVADLSLQGS
jgi:Putative rhamnosyl transferase